jgi:two-component system cell cycle response regulator
MEGTRGTQVCAVCGAVPPKARSEDALISTLGWRLRRSTNDQGESVLEWRCPTCSAERKKAGGSEPPASAPVQTQRFVNTAPRQAESVPPLPVEERDTEKAIALASSPVRDRAILTTMTGVTAGRVFAIAHGSTVIGRAPEADVWLEESSISREHARIVRRGPGKFEIEDMGSTNGTFVSGTKMDHAELESGDQIQLGPNLIFRFALVDETEMSLQKKLYESSTRDALTRAFNRKYLSERLVQEVAHARRHGANIAVLMIDIDNFKKTNDTYGHLAGDAVLRAVAEGVHGMVRVDDVFARYGGEEFVVLARSTEHDSAALLADRLRSAIESYHVRFDGKSIAVTVSIGIASLKEMPKGAGAIELLSLADARLYRAKEAGKNCICAED